MSMKSPHTSECRTREDVTFPVIGGCPLETRVLLEAVHDAVTLHLDDLRILWANRGAYEMFNLEPGEMKALRCHEALHGTGEPCEGCPVRKSFQTGRPETAHIESRTGRFFEIRTLPLSDEKGMVRHVLKFTHEVTEKIKLHAEAIRTDHLSSLGELAAGVAHEINNPVNGIINYAQMLANRFTSHEPERDLAGRIIAEGERIAGIVQSLLTFAGHGAHGKKESTLIDLLSDCLSLSHAQMRQDGIRLVLDLESDLPRILVDGRLMRRVFLNIISNSRHALNERYPSAHREKILRIGGKRIENECGTFLRVEFLDQGTGIPRNDLGKVLTPFFSTRSGGAGTGLGLSTSRNILKQHNGTIEVESAFGDYTRVTVQVPALEGKTDERVGD
jgi:signal transduction histidine kinase